MEARFVAERSLRAVSMISAARLLVAVASIVALLGCGSDGGGAPPPTTLRRLGLGADRLIGSAVDVAALNDDPEYRFLLAREFNYATAENAMKWGRSTQPRTPGTSAPPTASSTSPARTAWR